MIFRFRRRAGIVALMAAGWGAAVVSAEFMPPKDVPVDRLLKNTAAYLRENPNDPQGYYVFARINALAYVTRSGKLPCYGEGSETNLPGTELPWAARWSGGGEAGAAREAGGPSGEELVKYLKEAVRNFGKAVSMEPKNGLFRLGLAYILEKGAPDASEFPPGIEVPKLTDEEAKEAEECIRLLGDEDKDRRESALQKLMGWGARGAAAVLPRLQHEDAEVRGRLRKVLSRFWSDRALAEYIEAYRLSAPADSKVSRQPLQGLLRLVSCESGQIILRLLQAKSPSDEEKKLAEEIREHLKKIESLPPGPITPIVFSLRGADRVGDLLAEGVTARFDLDGDGAVETWPWVRPDTCFLAWDPADSGRIASGRQLFGSVTWWMFWNDGYHALDALDGDRDGRLSGSELRGLVAWQDRNSNGRSDPGEVVPVAALGIESIRARATHHDGACPASADGLRLRDGRVRPTFDWVTEPVPADRP